MATIKIKKNSGGKITYRAGMVSCMCCGCGYDFDLTEALGATYEHIPPTTTWPSDLQIEPFQDIGTFTEEASYPGTPPVSDNFIRVQRDNRRYGAFPRGGNINGSCARFICADISYNTITGENVIRMFPVPGSGGPTTTSSGRTLRQILMQYVPDSFWKRSRKVLFKLHFWGWELVTRSAKGAEIYNWLEASDTKFKIQYAEFKKITD